MPFIYNQYFRNKFPPYIFVNTIIFLAQLLGKLGWVWFSFFKLCFWKSGSFKKCGMKLVFFFFLNRVFGKNDQKVFCEKTHECLANTYKNGRLSCKDFWNLIHGTEA